MGHHLGPGFFLVIPDLECSAVRVHFCSPCPPRMPPRAVTLGDSTTGVCHPAPLPALNALGALPYSHC